MSMCHSGCVHLCLEIGDWRLEVGGVGAVSMGVSGLCGVAGVVGVAGSIPSS
jgi:hypothetical protein